MNRQIRFLLGKAGFQLNKTTIIDHRAEIVHPLDIVYGSIKMGSLPLILMDIPVARCRTQLWNTLESTQSPFVNTILDYSNNTVPHYHLSALKTYYDHYTPQNAAEVLRLENNQTLEQIPPYGYFLPWDNRTANEILKNREMIALRENKTEGKPLGLDAGHTDFGPVSAEKGAIEFKRLTSVYESIKKHGYKENILLPDGGIRGYFLVGENTKWCFIIKSGKHRAYALSALGYQNLPVIVDGSMATIKRDTDIPFWPQVKNGIFSEKEAALLFNSILFTEQHD